MSHQLVEGTSSRVIIAGRVKTQLLTHSGSVLVSLATTYLGTVPCLPRS